MVFGFLVVFVIQFLGRTLFFDQMYIENVHTKNINDINEAADLFEEGYDIFSIINDYELTDVSAYIVEDLEIFDEFIDFGELPSDEFDYKDELLEKDGVYYQSFEDPEVDATLSLYYKELFENKYLVFEHYLYGLNAANQALSMIDIYVIIGLAIFLVPYTYWYSRRFSKPLQAMNKQVSALSHLNFLEPLEVNSTDEIGELATSINSVSKSLERRISAFSCIRNNKSRRLNSR